MHDHGVCICATLQGVLRRMAVAVKIVDANTIVCRTPLIWRALAEASEASTSRLLRSSWVFNVSISLNGGHDVSYVNGSDVENFKCADTPLQYGLSMRDSDTLYRSATLCGHFRYVPMWQVDHLVSDLYHFDSGDVHLFLGVDAVACCLRCAGPVLWP